MNETKTRTHFKFNLLWLKEVFTQLVKDNWQVLYPSLNRSYGEQFVMVLKNVKKEVVAWEKEK